MIRSGHSSFRDPFVERYDIPFDIGMISLDPYLFPSRSREYDGSCGSVATWSAIMEGRDFARKALALIMLIAIAAGVFIVAPDGLRLVIALVALPIETLMLTSLIGGSHRRVPQA